MLEFGLEQFLGAEILHYPLQQAPTPVLFSSPHPRVCKTLRQLNNIISYNRGILQDKCQWDGETGLGMAGSWVPPL